ncbi:MAG: hypothetical protein HRT90_08370 [Candidatus Margulisbacteria bacterium]|nr:hypothetical protein [Candidatus Margulisiibacteriota bacterium]
MNQGIHPIEKIQIKNISKNEITIKNPSEKTNKYYKRPREKAELSSFLPKSKPVSKSSNFYLVYRVSPNNHRVTVSYEFDFSGAFLNKVS